MKMCKQNYSYIVSPRKHEIGSRIVVKQRAYFFIGLVSRFIEYWHPSYQTYEEFIQDLTMIPYDEGFTIEIVE